MESEAAPIPQPHPPPKNNNKTQEECFLQVIVFWEKTNCQITVLARADQFAAWFYHHTARITGRKRVMVM